MTTLRAVREIHVQHTSEGAEKVRRELDEQAASNDKLAKASENVATVTETTARRQQSVVGAYDRLRSSMDATFRAQQQFERGQRTLDRALEQGVIDAQQYGRDLDQLRARQMAVATANDNSARSMSRQAAELSNLRAAFDPAYAAARRMGEEVDNLARLERAGIEVAGGYEAALQGIIEKYDEAGQAARRAAEAQAVYIQSAREAQAAENARQIAANNQDRVNSLLGVRAPVSGAARASASVFEEDAAALARLRAELNPFAQAQARVNDELQQYQRWARAGEISTEELATATARGRQRLDELRQSLDRAGGSGDGMLARLGALATRMGPLLAGLGVGAGGLGGMAVLGDSSRRMEEAERAARRLEAVLDATGAAAGLSAREIASVADGIESQTGRAAEEVMAVAAQLATFTSIGRDEFQRTILVANDMADIFGGSLQSSLDAVARALDDPIKGFQNLRQRGFALEEQELELVKAFEAVGDAAAAQNVVLQNLERQVGGSAARAFDGLTKAQADATKQTEDAIDAFNRVSGAHEARIQTTRAFGSAMAFAGENMETIVPVAGTLTALVGARLATSFLTSTTASNAFGASLAALTTRAGAASAAMAILGGPVGIGVATVTAIGAAILMWARNGDEANRSLSEHENIVSQIRDRYREADEQRQQMSRRQLQDDFDAIKVEIEIDQDALSSARSALDNALNANIGDLRSRRRNPMAQELASMLEAFQETGTGASQLREQLRDLAIADPAFAHILDSVQALQGNFLDLLAQVDETSASLDINGQALADVEGRMRSTSDATMAAANAMASFQANLAAIREYDPDFTRRAKVQADLAAVNENYAAGMRELDTAYAGAARQSAEAIAREEELAASRAASTNAITGLTDAQARLAQYESTARISAMDGRAAALAREAQSYEALRKSITDAGEAGGDLGAVQGDLDRAQAAHEQTIASVNKRFDEQDASARKAAAGQRTASQAGEEATEALQRQIDALGLSEGAAAAAEFRARELARALQEVRQAGGDIIPKGVRDNIDDAAGQIEILTDRLARLRALAELERGQDETQRQIDIETRLVGVSGQARAVAVAGLEAENELRRQSISVTDEAGAAYVRNAQRLAAARVEIDRQTAAYEKQRDVLSNVASTFLDIFTDNSSDGFFDRIMKGLADIGHQFAELGKQKLLERLFGEGVGYTIGQPAPGQRSTAQPGFPAGTIEAANDNSLAINTRAVTALNDNLGRSSRSALDVARQFDGLNERADSKVLDSFMQASGNWKNLSAADTAWCAAFANAAIMTAGGQGTNSNRASSFLDWGMGTNNPQPGDIVLLKPQARGSSGHVTFFDGYDQNGNIRGFGGNQGNMARTSTYRADQVVAFRTAARDGVVDALGGVSGSGGSIPIPTARPGLSAPAQAANTGWFGEGGRLQQTLRSPFGQGAMNALGAFGAGQQGGSLSGAFTGGLGAIGMGLGPMGIVAGIGAGLLGGLFGGRQRRQQEHQARAQEWAAQSQEWAAYQEEVRTGTGPTSGLRASQEAMANRLGGFVQTGSAAWRMGSNNSSELFAKVGGELGEYFARTNAAFQQGFSATLDSLNRGLGMEGPFVQAQKDIVEAGKTLATFIDDTKVVFGEGSTEAQRAAEASIAQLRAMLGGGRELSEIETTILSMEGAAAALRSELEKLGASAEDASRAVGEDMSAAMGRLRADFTQSLQDQIDDLDGRGYLADFRNLIESVEATMRDATRIGGVDTSLVDTFFAKSAQNLVNQSQLTGDAFNELVRAFPPLTGVVKEFSQAVVTATEAEIRSAIEGYEERLFAAQNVGNEIALFERRAAQDRVEAAKFGPDAILAHEAAMAAERANMVRSSIQSSEDRLFAAQSGGNDLVAFERQAARERIEAAKFGADALAALEKTLAAERANIVLAGARADLDRAFQEHQEAANERIRALRTEASELERTVSRLKDFATQLREFRESLMLDANLSTLAPDARLAEAERQFRDIAARAAAGDEDAQRQLTGAGERYLTESRDFWGISERYYANFDEVRRVIEAQERAVQGQLTEAQRQLDAINRQITLEEEALALAQKQYDALLGIQTGVMSLGTAIAALSAAQAAARAASVNTGGGGAGAVGGGGGAGDTSFGRAVNYLNNNPDVAAGIAAGQTFGLPAGSSIEAIAKAHYERHGQYELGNPGRKAYANGGLILGPGSAMSDHVTMYGSAGEFMMRRAAVDKIGVPAMDWINQTGTLPSIQPPAPVFMNDNRNVVAAIDTLTAQNADLSRQVAHLTAMLKGTHDEAQVTRKEQLKAAAKAARVAEEEAA